MFPERRTLYEFPRRLALAVALVVLSAAPGLAAGAHPHAIVFDLYKRISAIGEDSRDPARLDAALAEAEHAMRAYIAENPTSNRLVRRNRTGMTPLIQAAFMGYGGLVEVMLESPKVATSIDWRDAKGVTAWGYANFAMRQSLLVCLPRATEHEAVWQPVAATAYYYFARDPYRRTRTALEAAGAETDASEVKAQWAQLCPEQSDTLRHKVRVADDILDTLIAESAANLQRTFTEDGALRNKSDKLRRRERLLRLGREEE